MKDQGKLATGAGACVPRVQHGGPDFDELRRLGLRRSDLTDFSVCTNPHGPSPRVAEALCDVRVDHYPDPESRRLRTALAEIHGVPPERILAGNGVSELIWLAAQAFVHGGERVLVLGPTYGEYARAALLRGAHLIHCNADEADAFAVKPTEVLADLRRSEPRVVFLCNPNNPTGMVLAPAVIDSWASARPHTLFIVDEAYQRFVPGLQSLIASALPNVLVLRSLTKDYALAGLRIGYAVGSENAIASLRNVRPPWSVNAFAQVAALAALGDQAHLERTLAELGAAKAEFVSALADAGLEVVPSQCHYFLVRVGHARAVRQKLLQRGYLVRAGDSFGLPEHIRLATRLRAENARLATVLKEPLTACVAPG